ncbi:prolipoprotein diacylglyceryl transferase [candidate division WWE3 bacterium CG08_land_8_20_14_0_20_41_10]|uniref:Phosphatidylglycerol--prolipoprotein diacylglyceryl transferase n=1 Tax=candidate division WWE3 bacterium CG08_land_8_20_14_0_20_41_10 TaxID=1975085 RepID=A0A2H0XAT0_UNCKA|nr:MAG: prolipoprotein diacylglyceryl transferase [candidate division WWE3 bacterium CG08_land_8_20_14_0_20_41_10]
MYGICIFLGIFLATLMGERLCKKRGLDVYIYWRAVFYALVFGLVGARFYHVVHHLDYFTLHYPEILAVWQGGLGIWGGIFGGLAGFYWSIRKSGKLWMYADIFAVVAPLAQAVGRWGNYFNKELFGYPTNLPWAIYIPQEFRPSNYLYFDRFHPLFLYESFLNLIVFIVLYRLYYRRKMFGINLSNGSISALYLVGYSTIRFFLEFMRPESWRIGNFPVASLISVSVALIISACLLYKVLRSNDLCNG